MVYKGVILLGPGPVGECDFCVAPWEILFDSTRTCGGKCFMYQLDTTDHILANCEICMGCCFTGGAIWLCGVHYEEYKYS